MFSISPAQHSPRIRSPKRFFPKSKKQHLCQICKKGQTIIPYAELFDYYKKKQEKKPITQPLCESCEKNLATIICQECNQNYCEQCASFIHKANKKFSQHKLLSFDQKSQIIKSKAILCNCPSNRNLEFFCLQCKCGICKFCSVTDHSGHEQVTTEEFKNEYEKCDFKKFKVFCK